MSTPKIRIAKNCYKDISAVSLENGYLSVTILPEYGGKTASVSDNLTGREFLLQAPGNRYRKQPYDGDYTTGECSGFDEMFPTIDPVPYPDFPWRGMVMPDHGEVCALSWHCCAESETILLSVDGLRFPYTLNKRYSFSGSRKLKIEYSAVNRSEYPFEYIYAPHLMLNVEDGGRILLPGVRNATWGFSRFPDGASYGCKLEWPFALLPSGNVRLDVTPPFNPNGNNYKFFADSPLNAGWCGYQYPDGTMFKLHFSPEDLPAFCIWVNEGWFHGYRNIALEPCSTAYDRIDIARLHDQRCILPPYGRKEWTLELEIASK